MTADLISVILALISTIFGALGGFIFTKASKNVNSLKTLILNKNVYLGFFMFFLSVSFYIAGLHRGELSVLYPITSFTFIWSTFLGRSFLGEKVTIKKWLGVLLIVLGSILVTR